MDSLIQIIIVVCLLIVIFLLSIDKVKIVKNKREITGNDNAPEIDIMGKPNVIRERVYTKPIDIHKKILGSTHDITLPKSVSKEVVEVQYSDRSSIDEDWDDEPLPYDDRFSQAVSMEEMMTVGKLLQQNDFGSEQENVVIDVMQKIQGTDLYGILENSIGNASQRIAQLLDRNLRINESAADDPKDSFDEFNIDDFV